MTGSTEWGLDTRMKAMYTVPTWDPPWRQWKWEQLEGRIHGPDAAFLSEALGQGRGWLFSPSIQSGKASSLAGAQIPVA